MPTPYVPPAQRFWPKVNKDGPIHPVLGTPCWIWLASKANRGYGIFSLDGRMQGSHCASWQLHNGPIPKGLFVLHRCDNPPCVNPDHLWLGTHQENMKDMTAKGRHIPPPLTHCKRGHEFTPENTIYWGEKPWRRCRACAITRYERSPRLINALRAPHDYYDSHGR